MGSQTRQNEASKDQNVAASIQSAQANARPEQTTTSKRQENVDNNQIPISCEMAAEQVRIAIISQN